MFSDTQLTVLYTFGIILGLLIIIRLLSTAGILFTKVPENHFAAITTLGGTVVKILWNNSRSTLDKKYEAIPCNSDVDDRFRGLTGFLRRTLDAWWIGVLTLPLIRSRKVAQFKIRRKRFVDEEETATSEKGAGKEKTAKRTGSIAKMVEVDHDESKNIVSTFKTIDIMPMAFFEVETRDNFHINVLLAIKWQVTNPYIIAFDVGTEKFFDGFETAVSDIVKRFVVTQDHKAYFENVSNTFDKDTGEEKKGNDVLLCEEVVSLNPRLRKDLGCEIISVYVRAYDQDSEATAGVKAITDAKNRKTVTKTDADAGLYKAQREAKGAAAEAQAYVTALGNDPALAAHVLGRQATPGLLVEGGGKRGGIQFTLPLPPTSPKPPRDTREKGATGKEKSPTDGE